MTKHNTDSLKQACIRQYQMSEAKETGPLSLHFPLIRSRQEIITKIKDVVDIPVVATIVSHKQDVGARIEAGSDILNVSAAANTPFVVRFIRERYPDIPIIATGGNSPESILATIEAGANAITWTPPTNGELFRGMMEDYRAHQPHHH